MTLLLHLCMQVHNPLSLQQTHSIIVYVHVLYYLCMYMYVHTQTASLIQYWRCFTLWPVMLLNIHGTTVSKLSRSTCRQYLQGIVLSRPGVLCNKHISIATCMCVCVRMYVHLYVRKYMYVHVHVCVCMYTDLPSAITFFTRSLFPPPRSTTCPTNLLPPPLPTSEAPPPPLR